MSESPPAEHQEDDVRMEDNDGAGGGAAREEGEKDLDLRLSDDESELSDVNEDDTNFDVGQIQFEQDIDADNLKSITRSKRTRKDDGGDARKDKKKSGRKERQLQKKSRRRRGEEEGEVDGEGAAEGGGRRRRRAAGEEGAERRRTVRMETPEEQLSDGERRRRQLQKNVEKILKKPKVKRRRAGVDDLENPFEEEVQQLRDKMADAARLDSEARKSDPPLPATHKLKMLPEVTAMLNRTGREAESVLVDPEINLMETVKFFLEPLEDGSLPAYNIQRDIFAALMHMRMPKESLMSSGIGKVILFYTKSKRPEQAIKLQAERLLAEWTRPILKRSDDYRKRALQEVEYDPSKAAARRRTTEVDRATLAQRQKAKALARPSARARIENPEIRQYTIVPKSNVLPGRR